MDNNTDNLSKRIPEASMTFEATPLEGHESRFALKLMAQNAAIKAGRRSRRRRAFMQAAGGVAAALLIWLSAYGFFVLHTPAPNPFEAKMTMLDLCYRQEIQRLSEEILHSAQTAEERAAAEECLRRFAASQTEYKRDIASTLPHSREGLRVVETHYATSLKVLRSLGQRVSTSEHEPDLLILK